MSTLKSLIVTHSSYRRSHACLFISYERLGSSTALNESLEDFAKGFCGFLAGNTDSKGYDFVETIHSCKDPNCILFFFRTEFLDQVVSQIVAYALAIQLEVFFHFRTDYDYDARELVFRYREWI